MKKEGDALEALPDPFLPIQRSSHLRHALVLHCNPSQAIALASGAAVAMFPTVTLAVTPSCTRCFGVQLLREHLRRHPSHAIASDDKRNGFNCISRKAIFSGLRRWFPDLIPTVALWYSKRRHLFLFNDEARDGSGDIFDSAEGCAQGDPLGPFLFAIGYHWTLLEMQVRHPSTLICAQPSALPYPSSCPCYPSFFFGGLC